MLYTDTFSLSLRMSVMVSSGKSSAPSEALVKIICWESGTLPPLLACEETCLLFDKRLTNSSHSQDIVGDSHLGNGKKQVGKQILCMGISPTFIHTECVWLKGGTGSIIRCADFLSRITNTTWLSGLIGFFNSKCSRNDNPCITFKTDK